MKRLTLALFLILSMTAFAQSEKRLALVVGNADYVGKGNTLQNPVNDAKDVSAKLKTLGFEVTTVLNASMLEMDDAIDAFGRKAKGYDIALFYYSGHGLQSKGDNYMMPVDAELRSEADVRYKCTPLNLLLAKLEESECPMKLVVLDACRDNPFERSWSRGSGSKGLSVVNAPKGTLITYATSPGRTAADGTGRSSPYTTAFLESLDIPNLSLSDFFDNVGTSVLEKTNDEQTPWIAKSPFRGSFYFNRKAVPAPVVETPTKPTQPVSQAPATSTNVDAGGHDYVDLGLPSGTLWATCNLGASKPEDYGNYYAWGETSTKSTYNWDTYKYANGDGRCKLTKYSIAGHNEGYNGFIDNLTELQPTDDPATVNWGSGWRTPSKAQWDELLAYTTNQWTTRKGVKGRLFTSKKNGLSVFFPAAGYIGNSTLYLPSSVCFYISRTLRSNRSDDAWNLYFTSDECSMTSTQRYGGHSVRPVRQK